MLGVRDGVGEGGGWGVSSVGRGGVDAELIFQREKA